MAEAARTRALPRRAVIVTLVGVAMVAAACGGSSKKAATGTPSTSTTEAASAADVTTSTTTATTVLSTGGSPQTTSTLRPTTKAATATTAKRKTNSIVPAPAAAKPVSVGIQNVVAAPTTVSSGQPPQPGGTLTELMPGSPSSLDPVVLNIDGSTDGAPAFAIFDPLVYSDTGGDGSIRPGIATSLTSNDGLTWTLKIRPGVKFSDGTTYDANAVKFNWLRHQDPNNHSTKASTANLIKTMDVPDSLTMVMTLVAANVQFPRSVAGLALIGSPKAIGERGAQFGSNPVGAGPFMFKEWIRDSRLSLVRNPTYWNAPRPYADALNFVPVTDEQQRINALNTGQANLLWTNQVASADSAQKGGSVPYPIASNGGANLVFNMTKPPFNDARLRKAVALALDRNEYSKVIDNSVIAPINSIFASNSPYYDASIQQLSPDAAQAQSLFDQVAADNGGSLNLTLGTYATSFTQTQAEYIQAVLQRFKGVKVSIDVAAIPVATARVNQQNYQFHVYNNHFDDPDPLFINLFLCTANPSPTGFCDKNFDADANDSRQTFDANKRIADFKDAQKIIYAAVPALWYERTYTWVFGAPSVQDVALYQNAVPFYDRLWIKTR